MDSDMLYAPTEFNMNPVFILLQFDFHSGIVYVR